MNIGKLKRVAIKEFTRSPAKTGFLLATLPIALYFCAPLLLGAVKKSAPSDRPVPAGKVAEQAAFVLPAATQAAEAPQRAERGWVDIGRALANDSLARPTIIPVEARNPFFADDPETSDKQDLTPENDEEAANTVNQISATNNPIRELGLTLNATVVGQRSRLATINGKTYREGETIPMPSDAGLAAGTVTAVPVELLRVDLRSVVLQMDRYRLRLPLHREETRDAIVVKSSRK